MTESENLLASQQKRRPYHYSNPIDNVSINASDQSEDFWSERANYSRYLYYNRLRRDTDPNDDDGFLLLPPHVIPSEFFYPQFMHSADGKQSSLVTIFALWNTMMGTSLLSMPWSLSKSGIVPGILLLCALAAVSFYTAFRILQVFEAHQSSAISDFAVLCKRLLGRWAQIAAVLFSALTLLGASIVYWVLMSNFLYHTVDYIHTATMLNDTTYNSSMLDVFCPSNDSSNEPEEGDTFHKYWNLYDTVPLFLIGVLGPLASIRSPSFFTKFNSLGTLSVMYLLVFVIVKWTKYGINVNWSDTTSPSYVPLYNSGFPALAGMLSMAYFIHNCIVTIMRNNRVPANNSRDLGVAYLFVALTYCIIGGIFYFIFPLDKTCISDNFLNNFLNQDSWAFTARIFLFFQMITVFPLIVYILRVQVFFAITKKEPNVSQTLLGNLIIISVCVLFAMKMPNIGTIIRYTGAVCGFFYLFFLPICLYLRWLHLMKSLTVTQTCIHALLICWALSNFALQFIVHED